jgi:hypothetical protein
MDLLRGDCIPGVPFVADRRSSSWARRSATAPSTALPFEGEQLRVYVRSPGYRADWHCQFPRDIREPGARYVVEAVREATQGGFYRAIGEIRRLRG